MGGKCNTHIMTLIHIIYGRRKCNTSTTIYGCTLYLVVDLWMVGFDECHIQTRTHKHQLNLTMGH
jgi:hypothetical protein